MPTCYVTFHVICIDAYHLMQVSCPECMAVTFVTLPEEGQVGRVKQPSYAGRGLHRGLGIWSYIPDAWFTHVTLMIHVSITAFAS